MIEAYSVDWLYLINMKSKAVDSNTGKNKLDEIILKSKNYRSRGYITVHIHSKRFYNTSVYTYLISERTPLALIVKDYIRR